MRIEIDSLLCIIIDADTDERIVKLSFKYGASNFQTILNAVLTKSQFAQQIEQDGVYAISEKRKTILLELADKYNSSVTEELPLTPIINPIK